MISVAPAANPAPAPASTVASATQLEAPTLPAARADLAAASTANPPTPAAGPELILLGHLRQIYNQEKSRLDQKLAAIDKLTEPRAIIAAYQEIINLHTNHLTQLEVFPESKLNCTHALANYHKRAALFLSTRLLVVTRCHLTRNQKLTAQEVDTRSTIRQFNKIIDNNNFSLFTYTLNNLKHRNLIYEDSIRSPALLGTSDANFIIIATPNTAAIRVCLKSCANQIDNENYAEVTILPGDLNADPHETRFPDIIEKRIYELIQSPHRTRAPELNDVTLEDIKEAQKQELESFEQPVHARTIATDHLRRVKENYLINAMNNLAHDTRGCRGLAKLFKQLANYLELRSRHLQDLIALAQAGSNQVLVTDLSQRKERVDKEMIESGRRAVYFEIIDSENLTTQLRYWLRNNLYTRRNDYMQLECLGDINRPVLAAAITEADWFRLAFKAEALNPESLRTVPAYSQTGQTSFTINNLYKKRVELVLEKFRLNGSIKAFLATRQGSPSLRAGIEFFVTSADDKVFPIFINHLNSDKIKLNRVDPTQSLDDIYTRIETILNQSSTYGTEKDFHTISRGEFAHLCIRLSHEK